MEEMGKSAVQPQRPVKTEWNSQCVLFTYFQGDIGSVVDEHFSRALSNVRSPQRLSPSSQSADVILRNDSDMPPNQWRFSSQWTKPEPEASFAYGATNCSFNGPGLMTMEQYPVSLAGSPSVPSGEPWHYPSPASPSSSEPGYSHAYSSGHVVPEPQPDGKYEPFLSLLQQDRYLAPPPQESAVWEDRSSAQLAGSPGLLFNLPPSSAHYKKIYFPPDGGPANASLPSEKSQSPERRNAFFY